MFKLIQVLKLNRPFHKMKLIITLALLVVSCQADNGKIKLRLPAPPKNIVKLPPGFTIKVPVLPVQVAAEPPKDSSTSTDPSGPTGATDSGATDSGATDSGATDSGATDSGATGATDSAKKDVFIYELFPGFELIFKGMPNVEFVKGEPATKSKSSKSKSKSDKSKSGSKTEGDADGEGDASTVASEGDAATTPSADDTPTPAAA